ncbi:FeoC-like transcriptional regulator [Photorhabdus namnaonensis]|uniref:FeoC-like transcriptional regulator n=1 Tax=Photorhabdus namnaonensis TaxID=1851568 RepID=UPI0013F4E819|nr:FeoC-like transcriptional regulator [Photorhabdus namnaonensis]
MIRITFISNSQYSFHCSSGNCHHKGILEQITVMGKLEKVDATACLSGSCKQCSEVQKCDTAVYRIARGY